MEQAMKNGVAVLPDAGPGKPGQFLETRQQLGVLPTWAFWNRADVWRTGRWFVVPVVGATVGLGLWLGQVVPGWAVPVVLVLFGPVPPMVTMGLLERYIRKRIRLSEPVAPARLTGPG
jgi:hypothetical protein